MNSACPLLKLLRLAGLVVLINGAIANGQKPQLVVQTGHTGTVTSLQIWDLPSGKQQKLLEGHMAPVNIVAFSPDSTLLASGADDNTIKLWNVATGKELRVLTGHQGSVRSLGFAPDGKMLASIATDGTIRLWDVGQRTPKSVATIGAPGKPLN